MSKKDDYANDYYAGITITGMSHTDKGGTGSCYGFALDQPGQCGVDA